MATKKQRDEFRQELEAYLLENGDRVRELLEESRVRSLNASWEAETRARLAREKEWYGEPEPAPADRRPRVVALKSFQHRGNPVEVGSIWLANHEAVASAPSAFAPVIED
jgi:hypothetical protein